MARVSLVGDGADQTGTCRRQVQIDEDRLRREREVNWLAVRTGRSVVIHGQFFMNS